MFTSKFAESSNKEIEIKDTTPEAFEAFLEFIYTDHCPIETSDSLGVLHLANRYGMSRLVTLCELYISKMIEKATAISVDKAEIDVINILMEAQTCNANQLAEFCLHFLSVNYGPMSKRKEWKTLEGENKNYVEEHQWPPVSYLKELETYEKAIGKGEKCNIM